SFCGWLEPITRVATGPPKGASSASCRARSDSHGPRLHTTGSGDTPSALRNSKYWFCTCCGACGGMRRDVNSQLKSRARARSKPSFTGACASAVTSPALMYTCRSTSTSKGRVASMRRMSASARQPRAFSKTSNSSTAGWPRTSDAGPGCTIHVTWHDGSCRLSALMTGRTCTASPMALIMTMPTRPRGLGVLGRAGGSPLGPRAPSAPSPAFTVGSDGGVGEVMRGHGQPLQIGFVECHVVRARHLARRPGEPTHVALGHMPGAWRVDRHAVHIQHQRANLAGAGARDENVPHVENRMTRAGTGERRQQLCHRVQNGTWR